MMKSGKCDNFAICVLLRVLAASQALVLVSINFKREEFPHRLQPASKPNESMKSKSLDFKGVGSPGREIFTTAALTLSLARGL